MDTWKISKNSDSAAQDALSDFIVEVNAPLPSVKTNFFETYGLNGSIDETEALGGVNYEDRNCTLFLITKSGISNPKLAVDTFINSYVGGKIRLHNTTHSYMLIGRITEVEQIKTKVADEYKLVCTVVCEPLRYYTAYTPNSTGYDLRPTAWSANLWSTSNIYNSALDSATVTATGGTIPPDATTNEHIYEVNANVLQNGKLVRVYLQNMVNCTIDVLHNGKAIGSGAGSHIFLSESAASTEILVVRVIDNTQNASFGCIIRSITATEMYTDGKTVPLQINSTYVPNVNYPVKMYLNGTIFTVKPDGNWKEYAPAMVKEGAGWIATFVDVSTFDPSAAGSSGVLNVRYRGGVL